MNVLKYTLGLLCTYFVFSCSETELDRFDDKKGGIYFSEQHRIGSIDQFKDTSYFSYVGLQGDEFVLPIRIAVMGFSSDIDRLISLRIDEKGTTAQPGVHYNLNTKEVKIAADSVEVILMIQLFKDPSLIDGDVTLKLVVEENEWFTPEPKESVIDPINNKVVSLNTHTIVITEKAEKPVVWGKWEKENLGIFTTKKFVLGNELRRWDASKWEEIPILTPQEIGRWAETLRTHLLNKDKEGAPIKEDELFDEDGANAKMWVPGIQNWTEGRPKLKQ